MYMKNLFLLICSFALLTTAAVAQNVGIGDPASPFTPTQRLHLKGNFLLEGDLRPNGAPGTAGQVLTSQGPDVAPSWEDATGGGTLVGTTNYITRWIANDNIGIGQMMDDNTQIHAGKGAGLPVLPTSDLNVFMQVTSTMPRSGTGATDPGPQSIALQATSTDSVGVKGVSTNSWGMWGETASADAGVFGLTTFAGGGLFSSAVRGEVAFVNTNNQIGHGVLGVTSRPMARLNTINLTGAANSEFNAASVTGWYEGNGAGHGVQSVSWTDVASSVGMYSLILPGDNFFATNQIPASTAGIRSDNWLGLGSSVLGVTSFLGIQDKLNPTIPGVSSVQGTNFMMSTFSQGIQGFAANTGDASATGNPAVDGPGLSNPTIEGRTFGVFGATNSKGHRSAGVFGIGRYTGGEKNYGVYGVGYSGADSTAGVFGTDFDDLLPRTDLTNNSAMGAATTSYGVIGKSINNVGVLGIHQSLAGDGAGTQGITYSQDGFSSGVYGLAWQQNGLNGPTFGVWGISDGDFEDAAGVFGQVENSFGANPRYGVFGITNEVNDGSAGVFGSSPLANQGQTYGVLGVSRSETAASSGVRGVSTSPSATNPTYGVYGFTNSTNANAAGVYGSAANTATVWAGYFEGRVRCTEGIEVPVNKNFIIDHPLDPANKYLRHHSIEAPEALNVYSGIVTTDASGNAVVSLPAYFESLNKDFRYTLTCINQFAQAIVTQKVQNNRFSIKTDKPNVEVSWVIYGTRNDPAYQQLALPTESAKEPQNVGKYLVPQAYGQPREKAIGYVANPGTELVDKQPVNIPTHRINRGMELKPDPKPTENWNEYLDQQAKTLINNGQKNPVNQTYKMNVPPTVTPEKVKQIKTAAVAR